MKDKLPQGLVVSCQALKGEPMYGGDSIVKMARAAELGGAIGIRANGTKDIGRISRKVDLPIIGLIKQCYEGSGVYITPTLKEVKKLVKSPCEIIAMDATIRPRPNGEKLGDLVRYVRDHSEKRLMADIDDLESAQNAEALGFDYISSTLRGYTEKTRGIAIPDIDFLRQLIVSVRRARAVAEGGIRDDGTITALLGYGYKTIIIGGAITRPMEITKNYVKIFENFREGNAAGHDSSGAREPSANKAYAYSVIPSEK